LFGDDATEIYSHNGPLQRPMHKHLTVTADGH